MRGPAAVLAALACALAAPLQASAEFGDGARLVSISPDRLEQADGRSSLLDISEDGRHVVFQTLARNLYPAGVTDPPGAFNEGGIFRRDLDTGALELVALGDVKTQGGGPLILLGARNPSISGDGRFVAFSTAAQLVPADTNTNVDVYVRDMDRPIEAPDAYDLVSARDGGDTPAAYGVAGANRPGSDVTAGASISADGRMVAFRTRAASDLPAADSPAAALGQVLVRDRAAKSTTLVTRNMSDGSPAGGATAAAAPVTISADGTTVVWTGGNAPAQTPFLGGEQVMDVYYLWRRVADGPSAPTRRITGVVDLDDPGCAPDSQVGDSPTAVGPCYGPLAYPEGIPTAGVPVDKLPAVSADGTRVAFLASPYPRPTNLTGNQLDVFVTDMSAGVSRKAGTIELTRESQQDLASVQPVTISGDGRHVVFATQRANFVLSSPRLLTDPVVTSSEVELYMVNLDTMEMRRITRALDGGETDGSAGDAVGAVSVSGDGRAVAFISSASNLFLGDSNSLADAFVTTDERGAGAAAAAGEPPFADVIPREDSEQTGQVLAVRLSRAPGGAVRIAVRAPGAGALSVSATSRLKTGRRRTVAHGRKRVTAAGRASLVLRPAARYRSVVRRQKRLRARLVIRFSPAPAGPSLTARRTASFTR